MKSKTERGRKEETEGESCLSLFLCLFWFGLGLVWFGVLRELVSFFFKARFLSGRIKKHFLEF